MRVFRRGLQSLLVFVLLACGNVHRETPAEMLERGEIRDGWLGTLLAVAVAGLLMLLLAMLQRRRGSTAYDGLFRPLQASELAQPLRNVIATYRERQAERAREDTLMVAAAEEAENARIRALRSSEPNLAAKVVGLDRRTVILEANQRVRITSGGGVRTGFLVDITEAALKVREDKPEATEIPWNEIHQIEVLVGPPRRYGIPLALTAVPALILGALGLLLDTVNSIGSSDKNAQFFLMFLLAGGAAGALLGTLIMYALPGPWWKTILVIPPDSVPLTLATVPAHAARTMGPTGTADADSGPTNPAEVLARVVLVILLTAVLWLMLVPLQG